MPEKFHRLRIFRTCFGLSAEAGHILADLNDRGRALGGTPVHFALLWLVCDNTSSVVLRSEPPRQGQGQGQHLISSGFQRESVSGRALLLQSGIKYSRVLEQDYAIAVSKSLIW